MAISSSFLDESDLMITNFLTSTGADEGTPGSSSDLEKFLVIVENITSNGLRRNTSDLFQSGSNSSISTIASQESKIDDDVGSIYYLKVHLPIYTSI